MPAKGRKRYGHVLDDRQIARWYDNISRGSHITADVYFRRFGSVLEEKSLSPHDLLKLEQGEFFKVLKEARLSGKAGVAPADLGALFRKYSISKLPLTERLQHPDVL
jgi:hypothetical protein